jgi:dipeptidyl aminopeptidase/acylaminoacyl peptidase
MPSVFQALSLSFLGILSAPVVFAAEPSIQDFINPALIEEGSLELSPSGTYFAFVVPSEDRDSLAIMDRASNKVTAALSLQKNQYVDQYWWVSDDRIVLSIDEKQGGYDTPAATGELFGLDARTGSNVYLFGYRGDGGSTGRGSAGGTGTHIKRSLATEASATVLEGRTDAAGTILIGINHWSGTGESSKMELARLNVKTGMLIKSGGKLPLRYVDSSMVDADGELRAIAGAAVTDDKSDTSSQLWWRDTKTNEWRLVFDEKRDGKLVWPLWRKEGGDSFYVEVAEPGRPNFLAVLDPVNGRLTPSYQPATADIGGTLKKADRNDVFAVISYDGSGRGGFVYLQPDSKEAQMMKALANEFPGELTAVTGFSEDAKYASVMVYGDVNPGEYYIYDSTARKLSAPIKIRPSINPDDAAVTEPLVFKARDGLEIHGWITLPNNPPGKMPMVVMPHGGPYGIVDRWYFDNEAQLLASRGYAVLRVNFRGSGGYGQDFIDAGLHEWGGKMISDVSDGVAAALAKHPVDPGRICIFGISYGAYSAMMGAAKSPELYRCAVGFSGAYDLNIMRSGSDIDDSSYGRAYLAEVLKDDQQWLQANSATTQAPHIKAKVLLIHGGEDDRTPPQHAEAMRRALTAAGNPPQWLYKPMEGHGFFDPKNRLEAYAKILEFLEANIGDKQQ